MDVLVAVAEELSLPAKKPKTVRVSALDLQIDPSTPGVQMQLIQVGVV